MIIGFYEDKISGTHHIADVVADNAVSEGILKRFGFLS